jgi:hypothetical protein
MNFSFQFTVMSTLGKRRHRWEDNIKMDLKEARLGGMDWIDRPVAGSCDHGKEPSGSTKFSGILDC